jgi:hypothetical protein
LLVVLRRLVEVISSLEDLGLKIIYFKLVHVAVQMMTATLWTGTNNGTVFIFTLAIPSGTRRSEEDVTCQLGKEIQLKHRAPVIAVAVIDGTNSPLPEPFAVEKGSSKQQEPPHRVVICSEEQFKVSKHRVHCSSGYVKATSAADILRTETVSDILPPIPTAFHLLWFFIYLFI